MNKKILGGLGLGAVLIILLAVLYAFYPGSAPEIAPGKAKTPTTESPSSTSALGKPGSRGPGGPISPEPPAPPITPPAVPPVVSRQPEVSPPPPATSLPPLEPTEEYGLLVKSYPQYQDAEKMLTQLRKQGKSVFIKRDDRRQVYEVWVGPFPSRDQAKMEAKSLQSKLKISVKLQQITIPVPK